MRIIGILLSLALIFPATGAFAGEDAQVPEKTASLNQILDDAISANIISGGVIAIGNSEGILYETARGRMDSGPDAPSITEDTIFDLASLTKVIATTPAIMKLVEQKKLSLSDPISRWFPSFRKRHGNITILNLLTHTSGLADINVRGGESIGSFIKRAAMERRRPVPGSRFDYADINFIILGELVKRVSGSRLDIFCRNKLFAPMGATDTMFLPPPDLAENIAPTLGNMSGTVQDENARRLGSVAGHAGLFSTVHDLARFARMLMGDGVIDDRKVLSKRAVAMMTTPYVCGRRGFIRTPGWDMESPYSAPRGEFSEYSFGHTGYSGSSIWIDPKLDLFVIVLTDRLDYDDTGKFKQFRRDISTVAVKEFTPTGDSPLPELQPNRSELLSSMAHPLPVHAASRKISKKSAKRRLVATIQERKKQGRHHRRRHGREMPRRQA